jgi:hypothetical protein
VDFTLNIDANAVIAIVVVIGVILVAKAIWYSK